ncbi:hypothetical protein HY489_03335 [Candidatus Woesearchaeota archaeon]|nr:hypothetical protein [Candidatus Woesearchaeota archaeon]
MAKKLLAARDKEVPVEEAENDVETSPLLPPKLPPAPKFPGSEPSEHSVRPAAVLFIALLSIGGLLFLAFLSNPSIVGEAVANPRVACCTTQEWRSAPTGYIQGALSTKNEYCSQFESIDGCCVRNAAMRTEGKVRLVGAKEGMCSYTLPKKEYPAFVRGDMHRLCCSVQTWQHSPTGFAQGVAKTFTGYCESYERDSQCCLRAGREITGQTVRLLGVRQGSCTPATPEKAYPMWIR